MASSARYGLLNERQKASIESFRQQENIIIPPSIDYSRFLINTFHDMFWTHLVLSLKGLSKESLERLELVRPRTLGAASRLEGVTPTAIVEIFSFIRRHETVSYDQPK